MIRSNFEPSWASAPGETILEILREKKLSQQRFAVLLGTNSTYISGLLNGGVKITTEVAEQLSVSLGASTEFWIKRENQFREDLERLTSKSKKLTSDWIKALPINDMVKFGWIKPSREVSETVNDCLRFFNVPTVQAWYSSYGTILNSTSYRTSRSFESRAEAVSAWLRQGEIIGKSLSCKPWNAELFREKINNIRKLSRKKKPGDFVPELERICAACGVALAIVRAPAGCRTSGATRFVAADQALILLTFRHLSDDQFWFTFFHEAGHLILHSHKLTFLDGIERDDTTKEESEANEFAGRVLVPQEFEGAIKKVRLDFREIMKLARTVGVSPGIIVGQLQHLGRVGYDKMNYLKRRYDWEEIEALVNRENE